MLRLDAEPVDFPTDSEPLPLSGGRPVHNATDLPATSLLQLETRPIGRSDRRLSLGLEFGERLRQPSLEPYRESIDEGGISGGRANIVSPNLALSAMISQVVELAGVSSSENRTRPTDSESVGGPAELISHLAVWPISGNTTQSKKYQRFQTAYYRHRDRKHPSEKTEYVKL